MKIFQSKKNPIFIIKFSNDLTIKFFLDDEKSNFINYLLINKVFNYNNNNSYVGTINKKMFFCCIDNNKSEIFGDEAVIFELLFDNEIMKCLKEVMKFLKKIDKDSYKELKDFIS